LLHASIDLTGLVAGTARGDRAAFAELYGRTAAKLLGIVIRIVRDRAIAEDVLQEVYLRVWQNAASYAPDAGRPMTWMISIARNRAIDVVRGRRILQLAQDEDGLDPLESVAEGRDREAEIIDMSRLRLCLGQLDAVQRRCLLEAYYDGYSREELAIRFGKPVNTIKTWLHRTAATLRTCLDAS
jgi:RNA polymerase sigma-70 factor (ECF subfamily)